MAVSQHMFAGSSDSSIMGGDLSVLESADSFLGGFAGMWASAASAAASSATWRFQEAARSDPKWAPHADKLSVSYHGDGFSYDVTGTDEDHQSIRELEHGGPSGDPSPLVRMTSAKDVHNLSKDLQFEMKL